MKRVHLISLALSMLLCFVLKAQEKSIEETIKKIDTTSFKWQNSSSKIEPSYILDGILINSLQLAKINPSDIQDIKIIKNAEENPYSCRGIYKTVIITTKKGIYKNLSEKELNLKLGLF